MRVIFRRRMAVLLCFVVAVGLVCGGTALGWKVADKRNYTVGNRYPLLDPSVSNPNVRQDIINFDPLRQNLKAYLASINIDHSLYFEYLPNGVNIRDGDDTSSVAASLMKTPVVMDMYKLAEENKLDIDKPVVLKASQINTDQDYGNPTRLQAGQTITLRRAAYITLQYSDNTTLDLIKDQITPLLNDGSDSIQSLDVTYNLSGGSLGDEQVLISARAYSSLLKCLYYACFNTPQDSTQMIQYLTGSAEQNRLMAGVSNGINVAHKVGSSTTSQSDCGIIYYPGKPYLICLMFLNLNPTNVNTVDPYFQKVSQMIYDYVSTSGSD